MPVIIRELHIKVNVEEKPPEPGRRNSQREENRDNIIDACVEKVLEVLKQKNNR